MPNSTPNIQPVFATANDEFYRAGRHRSAPIPETMTHVPDYPAKLRIYKIAASPFWQMRCHFKGKTYTKTTETTSKRTAFVKARDFFHSKVAELYGVVVQLTTEREVVFADLVDPTLAMHQGRVDRGEFTQNSLRMLRNRLHRYVVPVLGQVPIQDFGYQHGADFMQKLRGYGRPEDYVFMPELWDRLVMIMRYGYQLQRVQEVAGVGVNKSNGMKRTLYSLRHTAITLRLLYGGNIDLLTLARNARTSVEMIETYYSSNLEAEMNIGLLQGKRSK